MLSHWTGLVQSTTTSSAYHFSIGIHCWSWTNKLPHLIKSLWTVWRIGKSIHIQLKVVVSETDLLHRIRLLQAHFYNLGPSGASCAWPRSSWLVSLGAIQWSNGSRGTEQSSGHSEYVETVLTCHLFLCFIMHTTVNGILPRYKWWWLGFCNLCTQLWMEYSNGSDLLKGYNILQQDCGRYLFLQWHTSMNGY